MLFWRHGVALDTYMRFGRLNVLPISGANRSHRWSEVVHRCSTGFLSGGADCAASRTLALTTLPSCLAASLTTNVKRAWLAAGISWETL